MNEELEPIQRTTQTLPIERLEPDQVLFFPEDKTGYTVMKNFEFDTFRRPTVRFTSYLRDAHWIDEHNYIPAEFEWTAYRDGLGWHMQQGEELVEPYLGRHPKPYHGKHRFEDAQARLAERVEVISEIEDSINMGLD